MPINWILGHKPNNLPLALKDNLPYIRHLFPFRLIHSHSKARFGNKFQPDLLHKLSFLLLHLTYSYLSNKIILTLNVSSPPRMNTYLEVQLHEPQSNYKSIFVQPVTIKTSLWWTKPHFGEQAYNPSFS